MNTAKKQTENAFSQFALTNKLLQNLYKYKLTPTAKLVLLEISTCYNPKHGDMFPKQKTLANRIGVSERSIVRAISELVREGLIIIECKYTNHYKFTPKIIQECLYNLSDGTRQYGIEQNDNLSQHEPISEPINKHTEEDKILIKYANEHNARNIKAYVAKLKLNGSAEKILYEYKNAKKVTLVAMRNLEETQNLLNTYKQMADNVVSPALIPSLAKFREFAKKKALIKQGQG